MTEPDADESTDDLPESAHDADPDGSDTEEIVDGQLAYDCAAWAGETRRLLQSLLVTHGIAHAWQGTTLTVREEDEEAVDELIEEVSLSARPALDPHAPKVIYEVADWSASLQSELASALGASDIAYEWDERGDLVVLESDEDVVSLVIEELPDPDDTMISSDDGVAVHEVLDRLFMASDRLARDGGDASATVSFADVAQVIENLALPFGFEPGEWRTFVSRVRGVRALLDGGTVAEELVDADPADPDRADTAGAAGTDAEVAEAADQLRRLLRQYI